MYKKILVALDRGEIGEHVLDAAINLAKCSGAALHLLRVMSSADEHAPGLKEKGTPEYDRVWAAFEQDERATLESHLTTVTATGLTTEQSLVYGKPGQVICELATTWGADAIVIGHRQLSGLRELLLGSVSNYVVHRAPCSVLVVQGSPRTAPSI